MTTGSATRTNDHKHKHNKSLNSLAHIGHHLSRLQDSHAHPPRNIITLPRLPWTPFTPLPPAARSLLPQA